MKMGVVDVTSDRADRSFHIEFDGNGDVYQDEDVEITQGTVRGMMDLVRRIVRWANEHDKSGRTWTLKCEVKPTDHVDK